MHRLLLILITALMVSPVFAENTQLSCPEFPFFQPKTGPLAVINCDFHHSYEDRIKLIQKTFGEVNGRPIIMNLGGRLILKYNGKSQAVDINPPAYHMIKAYSHVVFTIYLLLSQEKAGILSPTLLIKLQKLQKDLNQAALVLPSLELTAESKIVIFKLVNLTNELLNKILTKRNWSNIELKLYYQKIGPVLKDAITMSAKLELQAIDKTVNKWLSEMKPDETKKLGVILALSHQPRAQEISLQYFEKRFGYQVGEGAMRENGLVVMEGQYDEKSAYSLLARHYLDREAAEVMFNDAERLQRDLLADAASSILSDKIQG